MAWKFNPFTGTLDQTGGGSSVSFPITETQGGTNQTGYAKGDLLYASAADTLAKLGLGGLEQFLHAGASGVPEWRDPFDIGKIISLHEHFTGSQTTGVTSGLMGTSWQLHAQGTGTGAIAQLNTSISTVANPGIMELATGTTSSGQAWIDDAPSGTQMQRIGGGYTLWSAVVMLSALSDSTNTYAAVTGIATAAPSSTGTMTDGIYLAYTHSVNSGNWTLYCSNSSTNSSVDTGVAASASAFQQIGWVLNAAGTSVQAYINGAAAGSPITTNLPSTTTAVRHFTAIQKSAGTTSRSLYVDALRRFTFLN